MAKNKSESEEQSTVPVLMAPREEAVVDGERVVFTWRPADDIQEYRVQVSADPSFDDVLLDQATDRRTSLVVEDAFLTDERTYFWRVIAKDKEGSLHGEDNIESFISRSASDEAAHIKSPDQEEEYGPVEGLVKGAAVEVAAEVSSDEKFDEQAESLGVEQEGVEAAQILGLTVAVAVALALSIFGLFHYFNITAATARFDAAGISGYPELRENRFDAQRKLSGYAVTDGEADRYRIPIDRAMELMANEAYSDQDGRDYSAELPLLPQE